MAPANSTRSGLGIRVWQTTIKDWPSWRGLSIVRTDPFPRESAARPLQIFFGCFDVLDGAGLKPLAVMRQAEETILSKGLVPEDFDGEFSVGCNHQDAGMHDANTRNDVGRFPLVPIKGIVAFDEKMIFALVMPNGFCFGLREEQKIHFGVIPITGQTIQRTFLFIRPDDVAVDGENRFVAQKRQRLLQTTARFQWLSFFGDFDGQAATIGDISGQLVLEVRDVDDDFFDPVRPQLVERIFNHRFACHGDQRFGHPVRQRLKPRAITGGQDHGCFDLTVHKVVARINFQNVSTNPSPVLPPPLRFGATCRTPSPRPIGERDGARGTCFNYKLFFANLYGVPSIVSRRPAWDGARPFATGVPHAANEVPYSDAFPLAGLTVQKWPARGCDATPPGWPGKFQKPSGRGQGTGPDTGPAFFLPTPPEHRAGHLPAVTPGHT